MARETDQGQLQVRPYRDGDLEAIYDICVRTGDHGGDATGKFENPRLLADIFAAPYLYLEPGLAFVLPDGADQPVGYVLGTADTAGFVSAVQGEMGPRGWLRTTLSRRRTPRPAMPGYGRSSISPNACCTPGSRISRPTFTSTSCLRTRAAGTDGA